MPPVLSFSAGLGSLFIVCFDVRENLVAVNVSVKLVYGGSLYLVGFLEYPVSCFNIVYIYFRFNGLVNIVRQIIKFSPFDSGSPIISIFLDLIVRSMLSICPFNDSTLFQGSFFFYSSFWSSKLRTLMSISSYRLLIFDRVLRIL